MFYDLQIVCVGIPPIVCKAIPSSVMNQWIKTIEDGQWLEIEPMKGKTIRINPMTVVLFDKTVTKFTEGSGDAGKQIILDH